MNFYTFIVDNWKLILEGVLLLVSFILFLIKKKPNQIIDPICEQIICMLPTFIQEAEKRFKESGSGPEKLQMVFDLVGFWFEQHEYKFTEFYKQFVLKYVEEILLCPQKKLEK